MMVKLRLLGICFWICGQRCCRCPFLRVWEKWLPLPVFFLLLPLGWGSGFYLQLAMSSWPVSSVRKTVKHPYPFCPSFQLPVMHWSPWTPVRTCCTLQRAAWTCLNSWQPVQHPDSAREEVITSLLGHEGGKRKGGKGASLAPFGDSISLHRTLGFILHVLSEGSSPVRHAQSIQFARGFVS